MINQAINRIEFLLTILVFICSCCITPAFAEEATAPQKTYISFDDAFANGVKLYQSQKYEEARQAFSESLKSSPMNVSANLNLGFTYYQLGQKIFALAHVRKAMSLDPTAETASKGLKYLEKSIEVKEISREIEFWESFRLQILTAYSWSQFLSIFAVILFAFIWLGLDFIRQVKLSKTQRQSLPEVSISKVLVSLIFCVFCVILASKWLDQRVPRATILSEKIWVMSAPNEKAAELFELYGGLEVKIEDQSGDWIQVTYPGTNSGWIKKDSAFQTSGF